MRFRFIGNTEIIMENIIKCKDLKHYFEVKNELLRRGNIEIPSNVPIKHGENYIKVDDFMFALTEKPNEEDN